MTNNYNLPIKKQKSPRRLAPYPISICGLYSILFICTVLFAASNLYAEAAPTISLKVRSSNLVKLSILVSSKRRLSGTRLEVIRAANGDGQYKKLARVKIGRSRSGSLIDHLSQDLHSVSYRSRLVGRLRSKWSKVASLILISNVADLNNNSDANDSDSSAEDIPTEGAPIVTVPESPEIALPAGYKNCTSLVKAEILNLVNATRVANGLGVVKDEVHLAKSSQTFAAHLARDSSLSHDGWLENILNSDFAGHYYGQNIAYMFGVSSASIMDGWLKSPGHRDNILNPDYIYMGVGCVQDPKGYAWWVQDFGG